MAQFRFRDRLMPGEKLIWEGQPPAGLLFVTQDFFLIPFGAVFLGFSIFWIVAATNTDQSPSIFFPLFGIPFVLVGLYTLIGRFFTDIWLRRRTAYAVTDKRILINRQPPFPRFTALSLAQLIEIDLVERGDGSGTIRFGPQTPWWNMEEGQVIYATPKFVAIPDARRVFDMIQNAKMASFGSAAQAPSPVRLGSGQNRT
jgi:hypothetical protein